MKKQKKIRKRTMYRATLYVIFVIYLLLLFKIILFKYFSVSDVIHNVGEGGQHGFRSLNLIPFVTVKEFVEIAAQGGVLRGTANILGNICVFAPLGYFLPLLFKPFQKIWKVLCAGLGLSLLFECGQYFLYLGSADIDDVILNFLGVCVGNGFYYFIGRYAKNNYIKYQITIFLSVVCFVIALFVAGKEFGSILGISLQKTVYEGQENIPEKDSEFGGTYLKIENDILYSYSGFVSEDSREKNLLTVKEHVLTDTTKYVKQDIRKEGRKTVLKYRILEDREVKKMEAYYSILLWFDDQEKVDTVLFTNKIKNSGNMVVSNEKSDKNEESSIWGDVTDLTKSGFKLNMGTDWEEGNSSIAVLGVDENINLTEVRVTSDTVYKKKIVHDMQGKDVEYENAQWNDVAAEKSVEIKGQEENGVFVASEVIIWVYTFLK